MRVAIENALYALSYLLTDMDTIVFCFIESQRGKRTKSY